MKVKKKKNLLALVFFAVLLLSYVLWLSWRPVEIVSVHHRSSGFSDVLVKSFPLTDKGRIKWWLENKDKLRENYHVPAPDKDGFFSVTFWSFGEGYKETDGYDRLFFDAV